MSAELAPFAPWVRHWFTQRFERPTPAQALGWPPVIAGDHVLLLAPTGSGKTLAAFLWGIDRTYRELREGPEARGVHLLYVSPLKALSNDIERNLREPLAGVMAAAARLGEHLPALRVAVRTGDTPSSARVRMARQRPHILITTPESLYLMLTSRHAAALFAGLRTVIVDEIHSLADNKRGVHLALSLERLERVAGGQVQRVGLSATQRPLEEVASFLGGQAWTGEDEGRAVAPRPVTVVDAGREKSLDLQVVTVVRDFAELHGESIWPAVVERVVKLIREHRTTLVFANSRRLAERFSERLNEHFGPGAIRAHHGSMSREVRHDLEQALKQRRLPALVSTSSLELGIDIGSVDLVIQLQSPKGVTPGLQRVGRSGHLVGQTSVGRIFATHAEDLMEAAVIARGMLHGEVEPVHTPRLCLDVLAQQTVAATAVESWDATALWRLFRQAYPYRELSWRLFASVLEMLSGRYPAELFRQLRARISWDRVNNRLIALPGTRPLAVTSGGTIPDRGAYGVYLADGKTKIGELDEEFVFESREGDVFSLGTHTWRVLEIAESKVTVADASGAVPRLPFWRGDYPWRRFEVGEALGRFRAEVAARLGDPGASDWLQTEYALDENSARCLLAYVRRQVEAMGAISSDRRVIAELFHDAIGDPRLVVHSPFGGRVNGAWALALASALRSERGLQVEYQADDDGILLRFPDAEADPPVDVVARLSPEEARERILAELPNSAAFGAQFRQNAARALLLPALAGKRRTPFWLQRLRARDLLAVARGLQDFPVVAETMRDCVRDVFDLEHLEEVLAKVQDGRIQVLQAETIVPSPLARSLLADFIGTYMYSWDAPKAERQLTGLALSREMLEEVLEQPAGLSELLQPEALAELEARLQHTAPGFRARSSEELAQLLYALGDLSIEEIRQRSDGEPDEWLEQLAREGRALEVALPASPGSAQRWIPAELAPIYTAAFGLQGASAATLRQAEARQKVLRRFLRAHGPFALADLRDRYGFDEAWLEQELEQLTASRKAVRGRLTGRAGEMQWCDRQNLGELHQRSLAVLRRQVEPVSVSTYADFMARYQHLHESRRLEGEEGLRRVVEQLRALWLPAGLWEREVLPSRISDYSPDLLDSLCEAGELVWVARGPADHPSRTRVAFLGRGEGARLLGPAPASAGGGLSPTAEQILGFLESEGACFTADLERALSRTHAQLQEGLTELVRAGLATNDRFQAARDLLDHRMPPLRQPISGLEEELTERVQRGPRGLPTPLARRQAKRRVQARLRGLRPIEGRWSLVNRVATWGRPAEPEEQAEAQARLLLTRYGIVTRQCLAREESSWSWVDLYPVLQRMELRGEARRGYFVRGLPGAQFALPEAVELLREWKDVRDDSLTVLNSYDPANVFAPGVEGLPVSPTGEALSLARQPATYWVLQRGRPCLIAEGSRIRAVEGTEEALMARALTRLVTHGAHTRAPGLPRRFRVTRWNGQPVLESPGRPLLESVGFHPRARDMEWWEG
jgi:ATP-dependent Lhr-like helicase